MADESVYSLIPPPAEAAAKPPRYHSKHPGAVSPTAVPCSNLGAKQVRAAATMGPGSGAVLVSPTRFLLAHEKEPVLPEPCKPSSPKARRKEPVPKRSEKPVLGLQSGKDFVTENVQEAARTAPLHPEEQQMDFLSKPWFGEVPPYLQQRMREAEQARTRAEEEAAHTGEAGPGVVQTLAGEELAALLAHLKLKWASLNEAYQKLPCVLDTPSKKRRKEVLEAQLAEIERDVRTLQRASVVAVAAD